MALFDDVVELDCLESMVEGLIIDAIFGARAEAEKLDNVQRKIRKFRGITEEQHRAWVEAQLDAEDD